MASPGLHLTKPCENCGKSYRQSRNDQRYCSSKCAGASWRSRQPKAHLVCPVCEIEFERRYANQIYCSVTCRLKRESEKKRVVSGVGKGGATRGKYLVPRKNCLICGNPFYAPPVLVRRGGGLYCSVSCRTKAFALNPNNYPRTRHRRGKGGRRTDLGDRYFRSSWEANYARYLNFLVSQGTITLWEYEPQVFEFTKIKRGSRFYTPDFRVTLSDGTVVFHEIKGYMDQRSQTKLNRMKKYYPEVTIELIDKVEYRKIAKLFSGILPGWE